MKNKTFQVNQNEKPHVGKLLDLPQIEKSLVFLDDCEVHARNEFDWKCSTTIGSFKCQDHHVFLSAFGVVLILLLLRGHKIFVVSLVDPFFKGCDIFQEHLPHISPPSFMISMAFRDAFGA